MIFRLMDPQYMLGDMYKLYHFKNEGHRYVKAALADGICHERITRWKEGKVEVKLCKSHFSGISP